MSVILRQDLEYVTSFLGPAQTPLSDGGRWLDGFVATGAWNGMQTGALGAYGTMVNAVPPYSDSCTFLLPPSGMVWGDNLLQETQYQLKNRGSWTGFHEVEHLFCATVGANFIQCYEVLYSILAPPTYHNIVRWNGPLGVVSGGGGAFTVLTQEDFTGWPGLQDGEWVKTTFIGGVFRTYHRTSAAAAYTGPYITYDTRNDTAGRLVRGLPGQAWWRNGSQVAQDDYTIRSLRVANLAA